MNKRIGFIGCGKMAQAMVTGILSSRKVRPEQIKASAKTDETLQRVKDKFSILITASNREVARWADILFLAVEPSIHNEVIKEIKNDISEDTIVITIAAGVSISMVEEQFERNIKVVRTMPNTPSLVGEGMTVLSANYQIGEGELEEVVALFRTFGEIEMLEERLMDSIPAISGSSPAYVYILIEALADGGVRDGIPREQAYRLASQAVLGAAKMVLTTGLHPGELKDQVCTPGGATIEAVSALEEYGFRRAVLHAMERCSEKTKCL